MVGALGNANAHEGLPRPLLRLNEAQLPRQANRAEVIERESQTDPTSAFLFSLDVIALLSITDLAE